MNGRIAKRLRKLAYGPDGASRFEQVVLHRINFLDELKKVIGVFEQKGANPLRKKYQQLKRLYQKGLVRL